MVEVDQITGLILAGGQGRRLGGVDKGLQLFAGQPLVQHALRRLAPQVGRVMISANRNLEAYRQMGVPVWPDPPELQGYQGPLAGVLAGLQACDTAYLVTIPCDCPRFPSDLVQRLSAAIGQALRRQEVVQQLAQEATQPLLMGPDETKAYIEAEVVKYVRLAKEAGIQPE